MRKCQNIKQPFGIQLTYMLESKIVKYVFWQNMTMFPATKSAMMTMIMCISMPRLSN